MKPFYTYSIVCWVIACLTINSSYGQSDSTRVEISQENVSVDSPTQINSTRTTKEKNLMKELFRRSRQEVTLIEMGFDQSSGVVVFKDPRPDIERTNLFGLWAGVEHKLTPAWALFSGVSWQFSPKTNLAPVSGSSWLGQAGLNYYPFIKKAIREGKSANNFYRQYYVTTRHFLPFHDKLPVEGNGLTQTITANPFQQATFVGVGLHSTRTRFYFYNVVVGAAYLYGRDTGIRHPIQAMLRISFGLGL